MNATQTFGDWLRSLRRSHDFTQEALADEVGCAVQTIRALESGKRRPSRAMAERLAQILELPAGQREHFLRAARTVADATAPEPQLSAPPAEQAERRFVESAHTLRVPATPLIGRAVEYNALVERLRAPETRMLTIVGPGGVGKTRLALQVAADLRAEYKGAVLMLTFTGVEDGDAALSALATALGVPQHGAAPLSGRVLAALDAAPILLLLDNLEHLIGQTILINLLAMIVRSAPKARLLVASREQLRIGGERVFDLTGLSLPAGDGSGPSDALLLFLDRAQRLDQDFALHSQNQADVATICRLLEGSPLAIELAAAWVSTLSPAEIAVEIGRSLDFLVLADRDAPTQHRSMRAVFERSWGLLTPDEQQVLMRLAVFRGGFTREAAGFVARAGLPQLAGLIQKSLLRRNDERFELHELIRFYSGEHLRASASAAATRHRHLDYSLALAAEAYAEFNRSGDARWHHSLDVEIDNLRAALRYALESESYEAGARLCAALRYYWAIRGHFEEALDWIGRFLSRARLSESARGYLLATRVTVLHMIGDHGHALGAAEEAIALHRAAGDEEGLAIALNVGGLAAMDTREFARAREYFAETLALHRGFGNTHREGAILCNMGYVTCYQGDFASALAAFRSAYDLAVRYDDRLVIASGQLGMALVLTLREDVSGFHHVCAALPVLHSQRYTLLVGNCIVVLAAQAGLQGQAELAGLALSCYEQYRSANKLAETPGAHLVNQSLCAMAERMASAPAWVSGRQRGRTMSVSELLEQCCLV